MPVRLLWSLSTDVTAGGSSGPIDLGQVDSLWLGVSVARPPGDKQLHSRLPLSVDFEVQDAGGVWFPVCTLSPAVYGYPPGAAVAQLSIGTMVAPTPQSERRLNYTTIPMVLPEYGRISWRPEGRPAPILEGTTFSLYGR